MLPLSVAAILLICQLATGSWDLALLSFVLFNVSLGIGLWWQVSREG
jgi:hypothetical protein